MKVTKTSMVSGITRTMDIPVTEAQFKAWEGGMMIQHAMPNLTADEREFIKTGITAEEWEATFNAD
jgi:hypothetical protein